MLLKREGETDVRSEFANARSAQKEPNDAPTLTSRLKANQSVIFFKTVTVTVIALMAVFVLSTVFSSSYYKNNWRKTINRGNYPITYMKNDGLYVKPKGKNANQLSAFVNNKKQPFKAVEDPNGKHTYFLENFDESKNVGVLFVTKNNKDKTMIAYNVSPAILPDSEGKGAAFLQNYDRETKTGGLCIYTTSGRTVKVDSDVFENEYAYSKDGKYLVYLKNSGNDEKDLMLYDGKEKTCVDSKVAQIVSVFNDRRVMYFKNIHEDNLGSELYGWDKKEGSKKIADGVYTGYLVKDDNSGVISFLTGKIEQHVFTLNLFSPMKGRTIVDTNVSAVFDSDLVHQNFVYAKNKTEKNAMGQLYIKFGNRDSQKVASAIYNQSQVLCSDDFKTVAYFENYDIQNKSGVLCKKQFNDSKMVNREKIDENVSEFGFSRDGKVCSYLKNLDEKRNGELYCYKSGKSVYIGKNVQNYNSKLTMSGKKLFYLENYDVEHSGGNLYVANIANDIATAKIDEKVFNNFYFRGDDSILYFKNYHENTQKGELKLYTNKKAESIDSGVSSILFEYSKKYE